MIHETKAMANAVIFYLILSACLTTLTRSAPSVEGDIADTSFDSPFGQNVDYNAVMSHFKDFFMYLPVVFSTFKETMSGFPKLAESIKILTSPYEKMYQDDDDCKCKTIPTQSSNEIDKSSNRYR